MCLLWLTLRRTLWDREVGMGWEISRALPSPAEWPGCKSELDTSCLLRLHFCSLRLRYRNSFALLSDQRGGPITQLITHQKSPRHSLSTRKDNPIKWFCPEMDFQPNLAYQTYLPRKWVSTQIENLPMGTVKTTGKLRTSRWIGRKNSLMTSVGNASYKAQWKICIWHTYSLSQPVARENLA